jgi:ABC-type phosphate transport system substrate-binding protein
MMKQWMYRLLPGLLLLSAVGVNAEVVHVIVNKNSAIESLDEKTIRKIFLGRPVSLAGATKLTPVDLLRTDPVYAIFYANVVKKNLAQIDAFWSRKLFNGTGLPPRQMKNTNEIVQWVEQHVDSIGYVNTEVLSSKVTVILTLD